jgi:hypothetical protein
VASKELLVNLPGEGLSPRPSIEPLFPDPPDAAIELPQAAVVRRLSVVLVVAPKFRVEGCLLFLHVVVSMFAAPGGDGLQSPPEALLHRLDVEYKFPSSTSRAFVHEAEEVESFGLGPHPFRPRLGLSPERYEARLFRMEGQPVLREPLGKHLHHLLGILSVLEAQRRIIGVPDLKDLAPETRLHVMLDPFIEDKVKIYVGEDRANYSPYAKGNFCFERVISGWRGALTVLDLRLKK